MKCRQWANVIPKNTVWLLARALKKCWTVNAYGYAGGEHMYNPLFRGRHARIMEVASHRVPISQFLLLFTLRTWLVPSLPSLTALDAHNLCTNRIPGLCFLGTWIHRNRNRRIVNFISLSSWDASRLLNFPGVVFDSPYYLYCFFFSNWEWKCSRSQKRLCTERSLDWHVHAPNGSRRTFCTATFRTEVSYTEII